MPDLIITEGVEVAPGEGGVDAELILSDGSAEVPLIGTTTGGVSLTAIVVPLFTYENTYAAGADTVGRRRIRSVAQNAEGSARMWIHDGASAGDFYAYIEDLETIVRSAHDNRGTLRYRPPNATSFQTFYLEAIWISDKPQVGYLLEKRHQEIELTFECRPNF
jgi:hypothetical protein